MNDLLLKNAVIYDGSGGPWYRGDVALRAGVISEIGTLTPGCASETIDPKAGSSPDGGRIPIPILLLVNDVDGKINKVCH